MSRAMMVRRLGTVLFIPFSGFVLYELTRNLVLNKSFRATYLFAVLAFGVLLGMTVRSYWNVQKSWAINVSAMQFWCWSIFDYYTAAFLGQVKNALIPALDEPNWVIQLMGVVIAVLLMVAMFPLGKRIHIHYKNKKGASIPSSKTWIMILGFAAFLVGVIQKSLMALENPVVDAMIHSFLLLLILSFSGIFGWYLLVYHTDEPATEQESKEQIELI